MKTFEQFQKQILHESSLNGLKNVSDKLNQAEQLLFGAYSDAQQLSKIDQENVVGMIQKAHSASIDAANAVNAVYQSASAEIGRRDAMWR